MTINTARLTTLWHTGADATATAQGQALITEHVRRLRSAHASPARHSRPETTIGDITMTRLTGIVILLGLYTVVTACLVAAS